MAGMFSGIFARGPAADAVSDEAWLEGMLAFEAALARVQARFGLISDTAAQKIAAACVPAHFEIAELGRAAANSAQPVVALVHALRARLTDDVADSAHHGATSQDVLDTAAMLLARRALHVTAGDARGAADRLAGLAAGHAETPMLGRTLLQPARATSAGLVIAGWMSALDEAAALAQATTSALPVQFGGPVGDLGGFGAHGPALLEALAAELGLAAPALPWHGDREPMLRVGSAAGALAAAAGKFGRDITLLAQGEIAEMRERPQPGRGGSSSMAHKQNPVSAVLAVACAVRVPGLIATLHATATGELQRAAGAWQAEWETLSDLLRLAGSAVAWARELAERLEVDPGAMAAHAGPEAPDLAAARALIDRALAARP